MENNIFNLENPAAFQDRFARGIRLLREVAVRVLGNSERVEEAIRKCFVSASRNPPKFRSDGAFYDWLVRILIDEALSIRCQEPSLALH